MRTSINALLAASALAGAIWALPGQARSYTLLGGTLDLGQRDYRFFNNFNDPSANSNTVPDPDFPGAIGAELAVWKGAAEWNSVLHGNGGTDPEHPDGIGSGASNFESFYAGLATEVGGVNDNTASMLSGFSAIHAFLEYPIGDGWRIRFYEGPDSWQDQPDPANWSGPFPWDIQGTMAHEYGHALGLDHTTVPGATMGVPLDLGVGLRSIEDDDRAGLQFLYGALSPNKPVIESYTLNGSQVTLQGRNFHPTNNEIWLTQRIAGGDGTPIQVFGQPSQLGGTQITFQFPASAKAGEVSVRLPGIANEDLSAPFPMDPLAEPTYNLPRAYGTSKTTSSGTVPSIQVTGVPSIQQGHFVLDLVGGPTFGNGIVLSAEARNQQPFFGGTLWIGGPIKRELVFNHQFGFARLQVPIPTGAIPGESRFYQLWFADAGDPNGVGLSHGVWVTYAE
ncbi:MAG: matrixin family metalloprotease [Planctomycetota bacterium]|nr:matrixin family metalloprotease [Planctomycetota bacterium]